MNQRLRHVYATEQGVTFVYSNHIRSYDLGSGKLTEDKRVRDAKNMEYEGVDVLPELAG